jgi:hypothetical protein
MSRLLLLAGVLCLAAIPAGCYALGKFSPHREGWDGLQTFGQMVLLIYAGSIVAGCFGLASLGCGVACARQRKHVLLWTVPLWIAAGYALTVGLYSIVMFLDSRLELVPPAKRDDLGGIMAVWLGLATLLSLASWLTEGVCRKQIRYFPWWSVPLWATGLVGAIATAM